MTIDPATRTLELLEIDETFRFYSQYMGKHQYLDNGTLQIVVPYEGRVLEVDSEGGILLEINNPFNDSNNAFVSDAIWLPPDFFETPPAELACTA